MKYQHLRQIANFLSGFKRISRIFRIADMAIFIEFDSKLALVFDLAKSGSAIYLASQSLGIKEYKAPFDTALFKRASGAKILKLACLENNRILKFDIEVASSYKSVKSELYFEFTGRFTNAIITANGVVIQALRHTQSPRKIMPNEPFSPLPPKPIKEASVESITDFNEFFSKTQNEINAKNLEQLRQIKLASCQKKIHSLEHSLSLLPSSDELDLQSKNAAQKAQLLLANLYKLKDYEREFSLKDLNGKEYEFKLTNSPKIEANELFEASKRLRAKASGVDRERQILNQKLEFNQRLALALSQAKSSDELEILMPKKRLNQKQKQKSENVRVFYVGDYKILLGKNEKGNVEVLQTARKNDIWLHLKDKPSTHTIIKSQKPNPSDEIIRLGARLCARFSLSSSGRYEVDYTKRENVKIQNGANVKYFDYKTIVVKI